MIVIINTGIGNFKSIQNMLRRIGEKSIISNNIDKIKKANKIILPGVGSFDRGMQALEKHNLIDTIREKAKSEQTKILGICLGMQMLADSSEEGSLPGLGLIKGHVKKFNFDNVLKAQKIPHIGWNYVIPSQNTPLFVGYEATPRFYFTHSYYFSCEAPNSSIAITPYGTDFCSAVQKGNVYGVQFHPEKSHRFGFQLLKNFVSC